MAGSSNKVAKFKAILAALGKESPKFASTTTALAALADAMLAEALRHSTATDSPKAAAAAEDFIVELLGPMYQTYMSGKLKPPTH